MWKGWVSDFKESLRNSYTEVMYTGILVQLEEVPGGWSVYSSSWSIYGSCMVKKHGYRSSMMF